MPAISVQLYTVRNFLQTPEDVAESLKKIRAIGYRFVEVSSLEHVPAPEIKSMLDDAGLQVSAIHFDFEPLLTNLEICLEQCRILGTKNIILVMMPQAYAQQGRAGFQRFIDEASPLCEKVRAAGFTISYHNHNYEFTRFDGRPALEWIFEATASHHLGVEIDTHWIQMGGGDPVAWIRKVAGRMNSVHLKDFTVDMWAPIFAEVGQGNLNWNEIIPACHETAWSGSSSSRTNAAATRSRA
ncbi:MAG: sugar phosphate isomerase/epimerase [Anaerolineales bacterium]|uniref:sugar phosphate isomerase/epimerase family protein n=1 Tax=Candidatus Villigracilis proximus TaxID=3140683 RepID=UPI00313587A3|nr:sugar phosphate isomerase/epimerase [Anaerolineales bacterium]